jgi:SAM-dependent methyltransferase
LQDDKARWNKKYLSCPMPSQVSPVVRDFIGFAHPGRALDIACGTGRNSVHMATGGFCVDAVDISDYALGQIPYDDKIHPIEADLDSYRFEQGCYDLIVNCNFLYRPHFPMIIEALRPGGVLIYETFVEAEGEGFHQPSNPNFLLKKRELLEAFSSLDVIYYEEKVATNLRGELVNVASFVGRQGEEHDNGL